MYWYAAYEPQKRIPIPDSPMAYIYVELSVRKNLGWCNKEVSSAMPPLDTRNWLVVVGQAKIATTPTLRPYIKTTPHLKTGIPYPMLIKST